jgi:Uma2 family endonuclease
MVRQLTSLPLVRGEWVPMTYEEWLDWVPDGNLGEWVDGRGVVFETASDEHQWTAVLLYSVVARFATLFGLGRAMFAPFHIRLWEGGPAREPDVLFVAVAHLDRWTSTRILGAVDLAAEVLSPESVTRDLVDKLREYALAGIVEYLLIDPRPGEWWMRLYRLYCTRPARIGRSSQTTRAGSISRPCPVSGSTRDGSNSDRCPRPKN